jgi:FkbM family methyltransferase
MASNFKSEMTFSWIDGAVLKIKHGMTGATGNVYCELHEFADMGFMLHLLRPGDLFLDVGANIGSYTVLSSKVCGARTIAFEPDSDATAALERNIEANDIADLVSVRRIALGDRDGEIAFTVGLDTMNRVAVQEDRIVQMVPIARLDAISEVAHPTFIKLDVEGYEQRVFAGAARVLASPSLLAIQSELCDGTISRTLNSFGFRQSFYDPFSRRLADMPFRDRSSNALYIKDIQIVRQRLASAPYRKIAGRCL